jgi:hypothetical protein
VLWEHEVAGSSPAAPTGIPANLHGHPAKTNEDGTARDDFLAFSAEECVVDYYPVD